MIEKDEAPLSKWRRLKASLFGRKMPEPAEEWPPTQDPEAATKSEPEETSPAAPFSSSLWPEPLAEKGKADRDKKTKSGSQKRQRDRKIFVVVGEAERTAICERARNAGLSTSAYGRACMLGDKGPRAKRGVPINQALLGQAIAALNRVGNNVNQIAHHLNAGGHPDSRQIAEIKAELSACFEGILRSLGRRTD